MASAAGDEVVPAPARPDRGEAGGGAVSPGTAAAIAAVNAAWGGDDFERYVTATHERYAGTPRERYTEPEWARERPTPAWKAYPGSSARERFTDPGWTGDRPGSPTWACDDFGHGDAWSAGSEPPSDDGDIVFSNDPRELESGWASREVTRHAPPAGAGGTAYRAPNPPAYNPRVHEYAAGSAPTGPTNIDSFVDMITDMVSALQTKVDGMEAQGAALARTVLRLETSVNERLGALERRLPRPARPPAQAPRRSLEEAMLAQRINRIDCALKSCERSKAASEGEGAAPGTSAADRALTETERLLRLEFYEKARRVAGYADALSTAERPRPPPSEWASPGEQPPPRPHPRGDDP